MFNKKRRCENEEISYFIGLASLVVIGVLITIVVMMFKVDDRVSSLESNVGNRLSELEAESQQLEAATANLEQRFEDLEIQSTLLTSLSLRIESLEDQITLLTASVDSNMGKCLGDIVSYIDDLDVYLRNVSAYLDNLYKYLRGWTIYLLLPPSGPPSWSSYWCSGY